MHMLFTIAEYVESLGKTWSGVGTLVDKSEGDKYKVIKSQKNYSDIFFLIFQLLRILL